MMENLNVELLNEAQTHQEVLHQQLTQVIDPELGIDVLNLGLIYKLDLNKKGDCKLTMTLTSMGCPLADEIMNGVRFALLDCDLVEFVNIDLVFSPAWSTSHMSRYARISLGVRA